MASEDIDKYTNIRTMEDPEEEKGGRDKMFKGIMTENFLIW